MIMRFFKHVPASEARAALLSITIGISLMAVKFVAYFITGSAAIFSDASESIANVLASFAAGWAISMAHAPADKDHPYGHGKAEFLSAAFEGGMIFLAGIMMVFKAIDSLQHGIKPEQVGWGLALMAFAMLVNGVVGLYLVRLGKKTGAMALEADGHHLMSDVITSIVAVITLLLMQWTGIWWLDPIGAMLIAFYIGWMGIKLVKRAADGLMDRQDTQDEQTTRKIIESHIGAAGKDPKICGFHKLRHRHTGRYHWIDVHITVNPNLSVRESHDAASKIEKEIEKDLGEADATAHIEPCKGCALCQTLADGP
jgi:cation diffusion facilitator family transporter